MNFRASACLLVVAGVLATSCRRPPSSSYQGYIVGEHVMVASPAAGRLVRLDVARGSRVEAGAGLFALDPEPESDAVEEARKNLDEARANLADLEKGRRPDEIDSLEHARLAIQAAQSYADIQLTRSKELYRTRVVSAENLNLYQSADLFFQEAVAALNSLIATWKLGGRDDQIAASKARLGAVEMQLRQADWTLGQKIQKAPSDALVFDTLYRPGEWVPAGRPVVSLLPPGGVRVRFFVGESGLAALATGDAVRVSADGVPPATGRISFISPVAEYSPPVIYSRENSSKLVFMVEASFDPKTAAALHPGQPVIVSRGAP